MIQSLCFHLGDALPQPVLNRWREELELGAPASLPARAKDRNPKRIPAFSNEPAEMPALPVARSPKQAELVRRIEKYLDAGHGACWLRRPDIAAAVEGALLHFDQERYRLLAWCVMPNHVHVLIETQLGWPLDTVLHSWKSFTSSRANRLLHRRGSLWQRDYFDRYVRNAEHYKKLMAYIENNPVKAGLAALKTMWRWSSARWRVA